MHSGIGLNSLADMRKHFDEYVTKLSALPPSEQLGLMFQHGNEQEVL